jgi:hypothetical protein
MPIGRIHMVLDKLTLEADISPVYNVQIVNRREPAT